MNLLQDSIQIECFANINPLPVVLTKFSFRGQVFFIGEVNRVSDLLIKPQYIHHLCPIYQCHRQQLALLSDSAVSSQRLFCLAIRLKCQHAYILASFELFLSLIAQSVQRHFYGMVSIAAILSSRIGLLKNNVSQYITFVHIGHAFFAAAHYILKAEMLFLLTIGECSYLQLSLTDQFLIWC